MISVQPLTGGGGAASYYLQHDGGCEHEHSPGPDGVEYYVNDRDPVGRWLGKGAAALGLSGALDPGQAGVLRELLAGSFAGEQLARPVWRYSDTGDRVDVRRCGFDVTFSAPKSVSVLLALGDTTVQEQTRAAHAAAVADALGLLEQLAARAARGHHGDGQRAPRISTSGLIAAGFEHHTSRAGDPQLHTHVVIANLAQGIDGRWSALDSRTLHRQATTASYLYQHRLRAELTTRLGVGWSNVDRGVAEITGVPEKVRRVFSTRRLQIEQHLATQPADETRSTRGRAKQLAARAACLITRPPKQHNEAHSLRESWRLRASTVGFTPQDLQALLVEDNTPGLVDSESLTAQVLSGNGVTRDNATFDQGAVVRELCERLPAGADVSIAELLGWAGRIVQQPDVVPVVSSEGRQYTTVEMLAAEQRALALAARQDTSLAALSTRDVAAQIARSGLRPDQQRAALAMLTSGRPVEILFGPAGSGKTAALRAATEAWNRQGIDVAGAAVAALTAQGLSAATGARAVSLARLLRRPDRHLPTGGVLLVDEAGMVGTRTLLQLLELTQRRDCKLVLVGDPAQLPEMEAGGLFAALSNSPAALALEGHGRQQHLWEQQALAALRAGRTVEALDTYDQHGQLDTATSREELHQHVVDAYLTARGQHTDPWQVTVLAARRNDVTELNEVIRQQLISTGQLGINKLTVDTAAGTVEYRTGEQVLVTRNDHQRGLFNGTTARVRDLDQDGLTLSTTDGRDVHVDRAWLEQGHLEHGYALTIHKAQGRTVHTSLLVGDLTLGAEAGYVGLSRGTHANHLFLDASDDPRTEQPCQPAPSWRRPMPRANQRDRGGALQRSQQQQLASHQLREGHQR